MAKSKEVYVLFVVPRKPSGIREERVVGIYSSHELAMKDVAKHEAKRDYTYAIELCMMNEWWTNWNMDMECEEHHDDIEDMWRHPT
jgi:hypothetical protein